MQALVELENASYRAPRRRGLFGPARPEILQQISFSICAGESIAVIGANGSGKTTLLRLLAGIYRPSAGKVTNRSATTSMLSIGVGFVPQLSGRENAILSGILLGFTRRQVESRIAQIREFSDLGAAFEAPLATYSSGMRARLGFSVSALLEPDLLLIDEVFAVGDKDFVKKSMAVMENKFRSTHTIVMVSHNLQLIGRICSRTLWIDKGRCRMDGPTEEVVAAYQGTAEAPVS